MRPVATTPQPMIANCIISDPPMVQQQRRISDEQQTCLCSNRRRCHSRWVRALARYNIAAVTETWFIQRALFCCAVVTRDKHEL